MGTFSFPPVPAGSYEIRFVRYAEPASTTVPQGAIRYNDERFLPSRLAPVPAGPTWWTAERVDLVDKDVTLAVQLQPGVRVTGRAVFEGADKPDAVSLSTRGIHLRSVDYRFFRPFQVGSVREDGPSATMSVPAGRYVLGMLDAFTEAL